MADTVITKPSCWQPFRRSFFWEKDSHQNNQQRFPVIFLLDSQWRLMSFMHSYGVLAYEKAVPESIIIGLNADSLTGPWAGDIDGFRRTFYGVPSNPPIKASDTDINRLQLRGRADELVNTVA